LKNPPEQKKGGKDKKAMRREEKERLKAGEAIDEENKKVKKESKKKGHEVASKVSKKKTGSDEDRSPPGSHVDENEEDDEVQWETNTSLEAAQQRIREKLTSATSEMVMLDTLEEHISKPTKKSAGKNEKVEVDKKSKAENGDEVAEKPMEKNVEETVLSKLNTMSIHDELLVAFKEHLKNGDTPKQLQNYMQSSDGSPQEIMNAYFEALFEGVGKGFSKEVSSKKGYLSGVVQDENSQSMLLGAIKRTYQGFCKHSMDVVQFDTTKNHFLAAGDEYMIKFWDMDSINLLTTIDVEGVLASTPRLRFNKEGTLLVVFNQ
jgi:translation initiation factor 5